MFREIDFLQNNRFACVTFAETLYLNAVMCKFESLRKQKSNA